MMDRVMALLVRWFVFLSGYAKKLGKTGVISYEEHRSGEPWKILLVGYNGARNTGADARVVALTEQLQKAFGTQMEITVMTLDAGNMKNYFSPEVKLLPFSSVFFVDVLRACSSHHGAILCEGSTLKSTFANALTMFFCEAAGIMKKQHKPCIAYGSEVGEMDGFLKRLAMDLCDDTYFITRTESSQARLEALGLQGHAGTDTAWTFSSGETEKTVERELMQYGWDGMRPLLGLAVINPFWWPVKPSLWKWLTGTLTGKRELQFQSWYFFSDSPKRRKQFQIYLEEIAAAVNRYCEEYHMQPVLFGMERLDAKAVARMQELLPMQVPVFTAGEKNVFEMTTALRMMDGLVTSRYHAAVLSMEQLVPLVAVSMDERLDGLLEEAGLLKYRIGVAELQRDILYEKMQQWNENRDAIELQLDAEKEKGKQTLSEMEIFLKNYLDNWSM